MPSSVALNFLMEFCQQYILSQVEMQSVFSFSGSSGLSSFSGLLGFEKHIRKSEDQWEVHPVRIRLLCLVGR